MSRDQDRETGIQEGLKMESMRRGPVTIVKMTGSAIPANVNDLETLFQKLLLDKCLFYVIELTGVRLINSQLIGVIIRHLQLLATLHGKLAFVNPSDRVRYLLEITCASILAPIYTDLEEAIREITPSE